MNRICIIAFLLFLGILPMSGQESHYTDSFLDSLQINRKKELNNYTMIGVQWGPSFNKISFNPTMQQGMLTTKKNFGITYTRYAKLFGFMPYVGMQAGIYYGQDGYKFEPDPEDGSYSYSVDGCYKCTYDYVNAMALMHLHVDIGQHAKIMANVGPYVGKRFKVHREGDMSPEYADKFFDYDRKFDFGAAFGGGFGFMLDPFEIHFTALVRWGMSNIYDPDYKSSYYYRYASPFDIQANIGIHYQLTRRTGKTKHALRKEAYEAIYVTGRK